MRQYSYYLVDVFTDSQFEGNQLAVFPYPKYLSDELMQKIANEFNLSETTFVLPPDNKTCDCRVRIFTPQRELPMAGHPTLGTAFILLSNGIIQPSNKDYLVFEEGVGPIRVDYELVDKIPQLIFMNQPSPEFGLVIEKTELLAELLSIKTEQIRNDIPVQVVSSGVPFLFVPLTDLKAIKKTKVRVDLLEDVLKDINTKELFVFTQETIKKESTVHCRMFAPGIGIEEDPATGGAHGPLGGYLVKYGLNDGKGIISEQGFEMGRPSIIHVEVKQNKKKITNVKVGGRCAVVGQGTISINL